MEEERRHEIINLQINMEKINNAIGYIKESLTKNDEQHKEIIHKIDIFIETADEKYATKNDLKFIQKIIFSIIGAICLTVLYAVLAKVIS